MDWKDLLIHSQGQRAQFAKNAIDAKGEPVVVCFGCLSGTMVKLETVDMRIGILGDLNDDIEL